MAFANRPVIDPAELDTAFAAKVEASTIGGLQQSVSSVSQAQTADQAAMADLEARVAALEAVQPPPGATAPTITSDPSVAFPGGTGDVNETFTITAGTIGGGANTGTAYRLVINGTPQGVTQTQLTGTLLSTYFTGARTFRVIQEVSWTGGGPIQRSSATYILNAIPAVPSTTGKPSITGVGGTTLTRGHTTWTNTPILDFHGRWYINGVAGPDQVTCTITNASPAVVTETTHGRSVGDQIEFGTSGALPTGLTVGTTYFIISAGFGASAYQVSLTAGGAAINTSSAGSGTHKVIGVTINSAAYPGANNPGVTYREQPSNSAGQASNYAESDPIVIPGAAIGTLTQAHSTAGGETAVNLTAEGVKDWYLFVDDTNTTQVMSGGVGGITVTPGGGGFLNSDGSSEYGRNHSATNGSPTGTFSGAGGGKILWGGAGSYVDITIPAGTTASDRHRLRFWSAETPDTLEVSAAWSDGSASITTYQFANSGQGLLDFIGGPNSAGATLNIRVKNVTGNGGIVLESITVVAQAGGGGGGGSGTVPSHLGAVHAEIPFADYAASRSSQSGIVGNLTVQVIGFSPRLQDTSETVGITGIGNVLGNPMRFGKVDDPLGLQFNGRTRKVWRFAILNTDPDTGPGVKRVDISAMPMQTSLAVGNVYWEAIEVLFPSNTYDATHPSVQGITWWAIHPGGSWGTTQMQINNGQMYIIGQNNVSPGAVRATPVSRTDFPAGVWVKGVRKVFLTTSASGYAQYWFDKGSGLVAQTLDTGGNADGGDYPKCDFYFGNAVMDTSRPGQEMFLRSQISPILDTGQTQAQIAALLT